MKRRKFVTTATTGAIAASAFGTTSSKGNIQSVERSIIEWRTYQMRWGKNSQMFMEYLTEMLKPAMIKGGASSFVMYKEKSIETPTNIHVQIVFPNMETYHKSLLLSESEEYQMITKEYDAQEASPYNRLSTSLLHSIAGMPQLMAPIENAGLFEIRYYEGYNEDAVRRKIAMFNDEEIDLFLDLQLQPIFFGRMVAGPYMPCLVYMLNYRDEEHRAEAWQEFLADSRWKKMVAEPKYANTVSNIRNVLLEVV